MSTYVQDTFTGTNGTALASHTPDTGGAYTSNQSGLVIQSNQLQGPLFGDARSWNATAPSSADYEVSLDVVLTGSSNNSGDFGVAARLTTGDGLTIHGGYEAYYDGANFNLRKWVSGTPTSLGTWAMAWAAGTYTLKLGLVGTALTVYVNGTSRITATDSAFSATGNAGIYGSGGTSNAALMVGDNFLVADAASGTTPTGSDSATVAESISNIKLSGPSDTSSESDTNKIGLGNTDSGTVSEQVGGIKLNAADAVAEAEQILGIKLGSSDSATEAESTSATAQVSASDSGTLTDSASASQNGGTTPSGSEGGSASETASVSANIAAAEIGTLAEQVAIRVSSSDSGSFAEQVANALLASAEGLAIVEQYQIAVSASAIDTAAVQEAVQLAIRLVAQDSAHMGDSQSVSTSGVSSIPFKTVVAQARTLTFVAQSRGLTFIAQAP